MLTSSVPATFIKKTILSPLHCVKSWGGVCIYLCACVFEGEGNFNLVLWKDKLYKNFMFLKLNKSETNLSESMSFESQTIAQMASIRHVFFIAFFPTESLII